MSHRQLDSRQVLRSEVYAVERPGVTDVKGKLNSWTWISKL